MKLGIITFWETQDNYGQIMQNYALQTVLRNMGHNPFLIRYSLFSDWAKSPNRWKAIFDFKRIFAFLKKKIFPSRNLMNSTEVDRDFDAFKERYLSYTQKIYRTLKELQADPPLADAYICGSDQIWYAINDYQVYKNITRAYFLDFGDQNIKRIAYAPSFGRVDFPIGYYEYISPLLQRFQLVTVREQGGVEVCKRAGYFHATQVLDPTCLLEADKYREICIKPQIKRKYVLLYFIGNSNIDFSEIILYAERYHYDIYYIGSQGRNLENIKRRYPFFNVICPTINEWLGWIDNCELFVTNSFHGSVFSVLFNKQNVIYTGHGLSREGGADRFYTFLESINLLDRIFVDNMSYLLDSKINYQKVNNLLQIKRTECLNLLKKSLEDSHEKYKC